MWCASCHCGSEYWTPYGLKKLKKLDQETKKWVTVFEGVCNVCKNTVMVDVNPLPQKPTRSIRAMSKRKDLNKKSNKKALKFDSSTHDDVEVITGTLKGRDYSDGM